MNMFQLILSISSERKITPKPVSSFDRKRYISAVFRSFCLRMRSFAKGQNCRCYCHLGLHLGYHLGCHLGLFLRPTFSTATEVNGTTVRNTSPSINSGVPPEEKAERIAVCEKQAVLFLKSYVYGFL